MPSVEDILKAFHAYSVDGDWQDCIEKYDPAFTEPIRDIFAICSPALISSNITQLETWLTLAQKKNAGYVKDGVYDAYENIYGQLNNSVRESLLISGEGFDKADDLAGTVMEKLLTVTFSLDRK